MNPPLRKVKAQADVIFFDAAGTLIHLTRSVGWHYAEVARQHGAVVDEAALIAAFQEVWKNLPQREPSNGPRDEDDKPWWKTIAVMTLRQSTKLPDTFDENAWFQDVYERFARPGVWSLHDDVRPCLERLHGRYQLAVISNFDGRLRRILEDLGVSSYFEYLFISSEMGCEKPHPQIFRKAVATMQVAPSQALHVGDDPRFDQKGATEAGLSSFLVCRPEVTLDQLRP